MKIKDKIRVCQPTVDEKTRQAVMEVFDRGWLGNGPKTKEFEKKFAKYIGKKYAMGCNSGTSALDLCLKSHGIKGGELITTPMTFVSSAIVGEWNGMEVTFADIDKDSLCLDPNSLVITEKTKAIITVDSHGRLSDIKGIRKKLKEAKSDAIIIEDAAHAMWTPGVGKDSDIVIFSFQAVKTMATADGGAVATDDPKINDRLRKLSWLGIEKSTWDRAQKNRFSWDYDIKIGNGIKGYMTDLTAAIALGQMERLSETNAKRRTIQARYNKEFQDIKEIKIPQYSHTVQYYTMQCERRDELIEYLAKKDIVTSVHFKPLSEMTYWKKAVKRPLPVTGKVWKKLISLPCHDALKFEQLEHVIRCVRKFYGYPYEVQSR